MKLHRETGFLLRFYSERLHTDTLWSRAFEGFYFEINSYLQEVGSPALNMYSHGDGNSVRSFALRPIKPSSEDAVVF